MCIPTNNIQLRCLVRQSVRIAISYCGRIPGQDCMFHKIPRVYVHPSTRFLQTLPHIKGTVCTADGSRIGQNLWFWMLCRVQEREIHIPCELFFAALEFEHVRKYGPERTQGPNICRHAVRRPLRGKRHVTVAVSSLYCRGRVQVKKKSHARGV